MPLDGSALAVVLLALGAALAWGTSDFTGGFLGRHGPLLGVLVLTQGAGFAVAVAVALVRGEPMLTGQDLALAIGGGALASIGVAALYGGLAIGRMGIVAPVAAVLTAVTPAAIAFLLDGIPGPLVLVGMAVAIVAVIVVSSVPGEIADRPSGVWLAVVAGVSLGLLGVVLTRVSHETLLAPLAVLRAVQVGTFLVVIAVRRRPWRLPRRIVPIGLAAGALDLTGNVIFLVAARDDLATTAVVSSLYPVVTVLLAASLLRERMSRPHLVGVGLAIVAIVLIAGGGS